MPNRPCPNCGADTKRRLDFSDEQRVNYYRCPACGHVWTTAKDDSGPIYHVTPLKPNDPSDPTDPEDGA
jgi:uncharacterized Zn finger protein